MIEWDKWTDFSFAESTWLEADINHVPQLHEHANILIILFYLSNKLFMYPARKQKLCLNPPTTP